MDPLFELDQQLVQDCFIMGDFPLCRLLLLNDTNYPWFILVPRIAGMEELHDLTGEQQQQFMQESSGLARALKEHFAGEKMNVAALGNAVRQLHVHHIVRYSSDKAWPGPVWGRFPAQPYGQNEVNEVMVRLVPLLGESFQPLNDKGRHYG
ncbi:HIT domain-containing protein [Endozoicomonas sp. Mp262]|uniref:HIT domain-containing protein n=1 Tax=Endozoicomonas sp. Mp262 TaxID=2919499 RepID=UPI0021DB3EE7